MTVHRNDPEQLCPQVPGLYEFLVRSLKFRSALFLMIALWSASGCTSTNYRYGHARNYHYSEDLAAIQGEQFERGESRPVIDGIGWVIGIPSKIILWDRRIDNHAVSPETEAAIAKYLDDNELDNVKVRVNQYAPGAEWQRLVANKSVGAGWRYTLGTVSWLGYTILPGRVFGGDNYNPFTNTINIYSDAPAIAIHEGGHAKDFSQRELPGTYAAIYAIVPFAPLYHEAIATNDALQYLRTEGTEEEEKEAYRLLYPAYGTYVGSSFGAPLFTIIGGHVVGRVRGSQIPGERNAESEHLAAVREKHDREVAYRQSQQHMRRRAANEQILAQQNPAARPAVNRNDGSKRKSAEPLTERPEREIQPAGHMAPEE